MGPNAIRISDRVEKVELDFASDESLKEGLGFARPYTIHTAKTNEMSQRLGFHIGGYCDDRGRGGPALAASLVGYECLPSDVVLFKMDEKYSPLPLNEEELNSLFVFLKTEDGLVKGPVDQRMCHQAFPLVRIPLSDYRGARHRSLTHPDAAAPPAPQRSRSSQSARHRCRPRGCARRRGPGCGRSF